MNACDTPAWATPLQSSGCWFERVSHLDLVGADVRAGPTAAAERYSATLRMLLIFRRTPSLIVPADERCAAGADESRRWGPEADTIAAMCSTHSSTGSSHQRLARTRSLVCSSNRKRIKRAGLPATIAKSGTFFVTMAPSPTTAPTPMRTSGRNNRALAQPRVGLDCKAAERDIVHL